MFNCTFFLRMHVRTILASNERKTKRKPTVLSFQDMINMVYLEQSVCTLYVFFSISIVIKMAVLGQNSPQFNDKGCYVTFKVQKKDPICLILRWEQSLTCLPPILKILIRSKFDHFSGL